MNHETTKFGPCDLRPQIVWILYGGPSGEREVSIKTTKNVEKALLAKGFDVETFDCRAGMLLDLPWQEKKPDIVFLGFHGQFGEDGVIQGFLEAAGIPFVGSGVFSSALSFHKGLTKKHLLNYGVPCASSYELHGEHGVHHLLKDMISRGELERTWCIKPAREGSTLGISKFDPHKIEMKDRESVFKKMCSESLRFDSCVLVEEWLDGEEVTIPILGNQVLPIVAIHPLSGFFDYESKYTKGKTEYVCPAKIQDSEMKKLNRIASQCFTLLECSDYARADFILTKKGPVFLELNTLPGLTETSLFPQSAKAAGMDYPDFLEKLLCLSYTRQKKVN